MAVSRAVLCSARNDWKTPKAVYQVLHSEFGFDFDPCPSKPLFDGLEVEWGQSTFCNPPYNQLYKWIRKGFEEHQKGKTVVFLVPARTDTKAWHEFILTKASEVRFISGRLYFDDGGERAPFPSAIVVFRAKAGHKGCGGPGYCMECSLEADQKKLDALAAPAKADGNICECGHSMGAHIYNEGACRPGFTCGSRCEKFAPTGGRRNG